MNVGVDEAVPHSQSQRSKVVDNPPCGGNTVHVVKIRIRQCAVDSVPNRKRSGIKQPKNNRTVRARPGAMKVRPCDCAHGIVTNLQLNLQLCKTQIELRFNVGFCRLSCSGTS